ncbi:hypothetical protein QBC47DRAFT_412378 [Echria macrotheca]|uniref:Uncharacterized protein n=1 Tax=Echria macrotheca TaxID=438768 RepID=A0AAJ0FDC4_9PEZI|nr:hypothetical protein QBC47DRAFT_412378 [Echria macrotheca]
MDDTDSDIDFSENTSPRADYTQGFGSFDFLPRDFADSVPGRIEYKYKIWPAERLRTVRGPTLELIKPFPFMKLPAEIRYQIYGILLARLFPGHNLYFDNNAVGRGVRFVVSDSAYASDLKEDDYAKMTVEYGFPVVDPPMEYRTVDEWRSISETFYRGDVLETYKAIRALEEKPDANGGDGSDNSSSDNGHGFRIPRGSARSAPLVPMESFPPLPAFPAPPVLTLADKAEEGEEEEVEEAGDFSPSPESVLGIDSTFFELEGASQLYRPYCVTISRVMDPDPDCETRQHEPDPDHLMFKTSFWLSQSLSPGEGLERYGCRYRPPRQDIDKCTCRYRTPLDYQIARDLSQVSRKFTAEMGSVLWTNATIEVFDPAVFGLFAHTRPAAFELVRGVVLHMACFGDSYDTEVATVREVCDAFNRRAERGRALRFFTVVLSAKRLAVPDYGAYTAEGHDSGSEGANFEAAAELRTAELATVFRGLQMAPGASFQVKFGRVPSTPPTLARGSCGLLAAVFRIFGRCRDAWLPECIRGTGH